MLLDYIFVQLLLLFILILKFTPILKFTLIYSNFEIGRAKSSLEYK